MFETLPPDDFLTMDDVPGDDARIAAVDAGFMPPAFPLDPGPLERICRTLDACEGRQGQLSPLPSLSGPWGTLLASHDIRHDGVHLEAKGTFQHTGGKGKPVPGPYEAVFETLFDPSSEPQVRHSQRERRAVGRPSELFKSAMSEWRATAERWIEDNRPILLGLHVRSRFGAAVPYAMAASRAGLRAARDMAELASWLEAHRWLSPAEPPRAGAVTFASASEASVLSEGVVETVRIGPDGVPTGSGFAAEAVRSALSARPEALREAALAAIYRNRRAAAERLRSAAVDGHRVADAFGRINAWLQRSGC